MGNNVGNTKKLWSRHSRVGQEIWILRRTELNRGALAYGVMDTSTLLKISTKTLLTLAKSVFLRRNDQNMEMSPQT